MKTRFIAKGSPLENGYVESFNSRFRDELLDRELLLSQADARSSTAGGSITITGGLRRPQCCFHYEVDFGYASANFSVSARSGSLTPDPLMQAGTSIGGRPLGPHWTTFELKIGEITLDPESHAEGCYLERCHPHTFCDRTGRSAYRRSVAAVGLR
jgi:Integrase core domain